jgi:hypothetical protein
MTKRGLMGSRRFIATGAIAALAVLAGAAGASAAPSAGSTDSAGRQAVAVQTQTHRPAGAGARESAFTVPSEYVPISPARVIDTRVTGTPVGQGSTMTVDLSSRTPSNATSVVLNVTGTAPTGYTFVSVYPTGEALPISTSLNLVPGQTRANQVSVALGTNRSITLYNNAGSTHLIVDLDGYYVDGLASVYNPVTPGRLLDTRFGPGPIGQIGPGGTVDVSFPWLSNTATAVTFNLTGVGATTNTFVSAYPLGQPVPLASTLNLGPGETVPNQVTVALGANKTVRVFNGNGAVHLILDMVGFYDTAVGYQFVAATPERAFDTRLPRPQQPPLPPLPPKPLDTSYYIALGGWGEVTDEVAIMAVAANLTGTNPNFGQHVIVYPGGATIPNTSNLNLVPGQTAPNAVNVGIGYDPQVGARTINFVNSAGQTDLIFDIFGYFVQYNG